MTCRRMIMQFASLLLIPAASPAQPAPEPGVHRLDQAAIQKILDDAAAKREAREKAIDKPGLQIQGQVGFSVGTGGYRSAYGTAVVPLPGDGFAAISLGSEKGRYDPYSDDGYRPYEPYRPFDPYARYR